MQTLTSWLKRASETFSGCGFPFSRPDRWSARTHAGGSSFSPGSASASGAQGRCRSRPPTQNSLLLVPTLKHPKRGLHHHLGCFFPYWLLHSHKCVHLLALSFKNIRYRLYKHTKWYAMCMYSSHYLNFKKTASAACCYWKLKYWTHRSESCKYPESAWRCWAPGCPPSLSSSSEGPAGAPPLPHSCLFFSSTPLLGGAGASLCPGVQSWWRRLNNPAAGRGLRIPMWACFFYQHSLQFHDGRFPVFCPLVLQEQFQDWRTGRGRFMINGTKQATDRPRAVVFLRAKLKKIRRCGEAKRLLSW